jgi:hypothetical protein
VLRGVIQAQEAWLGVLLLQLYLAAHHRWGREGSAP